jgi:DNA primase
MHKNSRYSGASSGPKIPIAKVLEHYGAPYVPEGRNRQMKCPFHGDDRNPSFSVNTIEGVARCFTCDVAGDGYAIIMQREGLSFGEAVDFATRILGIECEGLPQGPSGKRRRALSDDGEGPQSGQLGFLSAGVRRKPRLGP